MLPDKFAGGCACGAIRYRSDGVARYMGNCHCRDCQQATGSAYFPAVLVKATDFTLEKGEPKWFERQADRGHAMLRGFCPECGSPLFLINKASEGAMILFAGSLDDFVSAYNFARRLKTLNGLTPYEYICKIWTSEPERFRLDPTHQMPGLNT